MEKNIIVVTDNDLDKVYPKYTILIKEDKFAICNGVKKVSEYKFVPIFNAIEKADPHIEVEVSAETGTLDAKYYKDNRLDTNIDQNTYIEHFIPNSNMVKVYNHSGDHVGYFPSKYINGDSNITNGFAPGIGIRGK